MNAALLAASAVEANHMTWPEAAFYITLAIVGGFVAWAVTR